MKGGGNGGKAFDEMPVVPSSTKKIFDLGGSGDVSNGLEECGVRQDTIMGNYVTKEGNTGTDKVTFGRVRFDASLLNMKKDLEMTMMSSR